MNSCVLVQYISAVCEMDTVNTLQYIQLLQQNESHLIKVQVFFYSIRQLAACA